MRKTGPILILIIGILALIIDFVPGLSAPWEPDRVFETKVGLDLQGGLRVEYQAQPVEGRSAGQGDLDVIRTIIENRVNSTGVAEPVITVQGNDRIVVELPGVSDPNAIRNLVGQTGSLDFVPLGKTSKAKGDTIDSNQFPALFGGTELSSATIGQNQTLGRVVTFQLKDTGAKLFGEYTAQHIGDFFAIVLDHRVISAPTIDSAIPGGSVEISQKGTIGGYPLKEATELVTVLQYGSLPFPIKELSSQTISATLGEQFL
ncbi:MAG TPA: hypothetical protein VHM48_14200, partial [Candidatus Limnocylindrales bacterium]|nr:hypothetical protein [Candidatus Limnocylindrales bacterium]